MRAVLFAVSFTVVSILASGGAVAQVDSYRPGPAYSAVAANSPDQCVAACAGDAACRGWNFVTLRMASEHAQARAVCEFLSRDVAPVPSAGSVSGIAAGVQASAHRSESRLVRSTPSPTVRVGEPSTGQPFAIARRTIEAVPARAQIADRRIAVKRSAPVQPAMDGTATRPAPRFRHVLDGGPVAAPLMMAPARGQPPAVASVQPRPMPMPVPMPPPMPVPVPVSKPVAPVAPPAATTAPDGVAPTARSPFAAQPHASIRTPPRPTPDVPPQQPRSSGLFGNLYDDVAIPAPVSADAARNADAPIATSVSVPVAPHMSDMAGGS